MTTVVTIDASAREGDGTYVAFDQVVGPMAIGADAMVIEPMAGLMGDGRISEIDQAGKRVFVIVEWESLRVPPQDDSPDDEGGGSAFESGNEKYGWKAIGPGGFRFDGPKGRPASRKTGPLVGGGAHAAPDSAPKVTAIQAAPPDPAGGGEE
jgi:hypothetical protein